MHALRLLAVPAFADNYVWLLADAEGNAVAVDPGDAAPVRAALAREGLRLSAILVTHHHGDHIGGVPELLAQAKVPVYAPEDARIDTATVRVGDGDHVVIPLPAASFEVIAVPGHTSSHIAYYGQGLLFCGDTLFSIGCGRLFEGTPEQMLASLDRLAALPGDTRVCCGHEYTLANCVFAQTIAPGNADLVARTHAVQALRSQHQATLPARLAEERACNPFLRIDTPEIASALADEVSPQADRVERFAALRRRKDHFRMPTA